MSGRSALAAGGFSDEYRIERDWTASGTGLIRSMATARLRLGVVADMGTWTENLPWEMALTMVEMRGEDCLGHTNGATRISRTAILWLTLFEVEKNMYVYPGAGLSVNFFNWGLTDPAETTDDSDTELTLTMIGRFPVPDCEQVAWSSRIAV